MKKLFIGLLTFVSTSLFADCIVHVEGNNKDVKFLKNLLIKSPGVVIGNTADYDVKLSSTSGKKRFQDSKGIYPRVKKYVKVSLQDRSNQIIERNSATGRVIEAPCLPGNSPCSIGAYDGGLALSRTNKLLKKAVLEMKYFRSCSAD